MSYDADWRVGLSTGSFDSRTFRGLSPDIQREFFNRLEREMSSATWSLNHSVPVKDCWELYVKARESLARHYECLTADGGRALTWHEYLISNPEKGYGTQPG